MARSRTLDRLLLAVLGVGILWQGWNLQAVRRDLRDVSGRLTELEVRAKLAQDAGRARLSVPLAPELFQAPPSGGRAQAAPRAALPTAEPEGAAHGGGRGLGARARGNTPPVPGSVVINKLYDAADALAAEEDWDPETYDAVARVFEDTTSEMLSLYEHLQQGTVNAGAARREALAIRDDAQVRLAEVLGPEGFEKLRDQIREDLAPLGPNR